MRALVLVLGVIVIYLAVNGRLMAAIDAIRAPGPAPRATGGAFPGVGGGGGSSGFG